MSSVCRFMANKCEAKCHSDSASSHTTSDSSQACCRSSGECKCVCVPTIRGRRVSKFIPDLTQRQANKIYSEVVSVIRNKSDERYTINLPIPTEFRNQSDAVFPGQCARDGTGYNGTNTIRYQTTSVPTKFEWKKLPLCFKKLSDEETSIIVVAGKFFEIKKHKPEAPFEFILKDLKAWARAFPERRMAAYPKLS